MEHSTRLWKKLVVKAIIALMMLESSNWQRGRLLIRIGSEEDCVLVDVTSNEHFYSSRSRCSCRFCFIIKPQNSHQPSNLFITITHFEHIRIAPILPMRQAHGLPSNRELLPESLCTKTAPSNPPPMTHARPY